MRYCTHLDRSQNRHSQLVPLEQLLQNAHRLIESHVLVDRQHFISCCRFFDERLRGRKIHCQRFLGQYAAHMFLSESMTDQLWLLIGRKSDIDDLNIRIFYQLVRCLVNGGNFPAVRDFCRLFRPPRSDRDDRKTGRGVS